MGTGPLKGLVFLLLYCVSTTEGEIRCYCNESGCVTTGYMCKSQLGMCYSLVKYKDDTMDPAQSTVVHGCADTLDREPRMRTCAGHGLEINDVELQVNASETRTVTNTVEVVEVQEVKTENVEKTKDNFNDITNNVDPTEPVLTCCTQDMCNYRDLRIIIDTQSNRKGIAGGSEEGITSKRTDDGQKPQKDLWFKAAVIAVPIAGGFILILLVLLAVRMLRSDSRQHRRLIQIRRERSLTKAQLYVTDHFIDKESSVKCSPSSDTNNCSHQPNSHVHSHVHSHTSKRDSHSHTHSHRHSNSHQHQSHQQSHKHCGQKVTTNKDGHTYEQIVTQNSEGGFPCCENSPKDINRTSPYPSVIVSWGKPNKTDAADVV